MNIIIYNLLNLSKKDPYLFLDKELLLRKEKNFLFALKPILNSYSKSLWSPDNYMQQLCEIEPVVTRFFEDVMVMDEDPVKCGNRLWLCQQLAQWSGRHLDLQSIVFA